MRVVEDCRRFRILVYCCCKDVVMTTTISETKTVYFSTQIINPTQLLLHREEGDTTKAIALPEKKTSGNKKTTHPRPKTKRVVTQTDHWQALTEHQDDRMTQWLQQKTSEDDTNNNNNNCSDARKVHQQILAKRSGYRAQDQLKGIFDLEKFVTFSDVLTLLNSSGLACYYCKDPVLVLYDYVREPRQWTLERLDNRFGHNRDNVVLACLQCNLRRRTMLSERYVQTQEMKRVVKIIPDTDKRI